MSQVLLQSFWTISSPSSMRSCSLPAKLSPSFCYVQHAVSPPAKLSANISDPFPVRSHPRSRGRSSLRASLPTHFQPLRCTHAVRSNPRSSPHPFAVRSRPRSRGRSSPAASSPHPFPATPLHPRRPQPSTQFSAPICRPHPSAQPRSLITSAFLSPPISSHPVAPTPSAAIRAVLRTHLPSAAVPTAKVAHHQRLLLPTHFQPPRCTHAVRSRARSSAHLFAVRSRPHSQGRSSPAASSPHPFPATPLHPRRPQQSAQFSAPICRPQPSPQPRSLITSGFFFPPISSHPVAPTPSAAVRAVLRTYLPSAAVQGQGRSSPAASSPHPFPATPLHPRRPQPSAQPMSLITSGFFSPPISSHSVAPTPSAAVHAVLRIHLPSAPVRAAEVAHHQRLLLRTHFQPLRCTHAVRSRPRSSPHPFAVRSRPRSQGRSSLRASSPHPFPATPLHPRRPQQSAQFSAPICRPQPSPQPRSLITSGFFSPPISSHPVAPTPSAAVRAVLRTYLPSAAVQGQGRSSPAASSPHPFPATPLHPRRPQPSAQPRSLITSGFFSPPISSQSVAPTPSAAVHAVLRIHLPSAPVRAAEVAHQQRLLLRTHFQPLRCTHAVRSRPRSSPHPFAVRSRPRSQGRSSLRASSPQPFPATPLHPRHPQQSAQFSAPICRPQPSAQPRSLITSGFFSAPISSHSVAPTASAAVRAISAPICRPHPSAEPRSLITTGFFSPPISSHSVAPTPSAAIRAVLRTHLPSAAVRAAEVAHHQRLLLRTHFHPLRCTHAVRSRPRNFRTHLPSAAVRAAEVAHHQRLLLRTHFQPLRCTHAVRSRPRNFRTHLPSAAVRAAEVAHHQRLLLRTHFQPLRCTHAVRSRPRNFRTHLPSAPPRSLPHAVKQLNENPSIEDAFGKKEAAGPTWYIYIYIMCIYIYTPNYIHTVVCVHMCVRTWFHQIVTPYQYAPWRSASGGQMYDQGSQVCGRGWRNSASKQCQVVV